ncbi:MAG: Asr1405/Asl0597 family protein [Cyanobacteria bacterium J06600_6]
MSDRNSEFNIPVDEQSKREIGVKWAYRWEVYRRLKSLGIDCQCSTNEPLLVNLDSPTTLIQIWSVVRQSNVERGQLVNWLDNCWDLQGERHNRQNF